MQNPTASHRRRFLVGRHLFFRTSPTGVVFSSIVIVARFVPESNDIVRRACTEETKELCLPVDRSTVSLQP